MGAAGRAYALAQFSWERIAEVTVELYEWLLNGGTPPSVVQQ
jgi:glycosyltransferase involved in cell wall biosynthesis